MLRLGLLVGIGFGALVALLLREPIPEEEAAPEEAEEPPVKSALRKVKSQVRQAQLAAHEAAAEKEAEMRREFEETLRREKQR